MLRLSKNAAYLTSAATFLASIALLVSATAASAGTVTWATSPADTNFENTANWAGGAIPANSLATDIAQFTGTVPANQPQITTSRSINGLVFSTATGGWTLSSNSAANVLSIGSGGILTGTNATFTSGQTSGTNTISANIALGAAQNWGVGTGGTLVVSGNITGSSALTIGLSPGNTGFVVLSGSNTNNGGITVRSQTSAGPGKLGIGSSNAITAGTLTMGDNGGGTATLDAYNGNQTIGSGVSLVFAAATDNFVGTNNLTFNGNTTANASFGTKALTVTAGRLTLAGSVTFNSYITKNGAGTLVLSGSNTGTGSAGTSVVGAVATAFPGVNVVVAITTGTVELGNANALSAGNLQMNSGTVTAGTALTGANKVVGGLVLNNTTTAVIGGTNALEFGGTLLSGSGNNTLAINNTGGTTFSGNVLLQESTVSVGRTLTLSGSGAVTISGSIADGGTGGNSALIYNGTSTLTLSGSNSYSGGTSLSSAGTVNIGNDFALGTGSFTASSSSGILLASGGARTIANNVILTASPTISGANSLTINGTLTNSGNNRTLNTTLTTGTLTLGGNVNLSESNASSRTLTIGSTTASGAVGTTTLISGIIQDNSLASGSASNFAVSGGGTTILTGSNTYTGTTTVSNGGTLLQVGNGGATGNLGAGAVTVTTGTLAFNRNNSVTVTNNISGSGSLAQIGSGATIVSGTASHTGGTTISSGTLQFGNGTIGAYTGTGNISNSAALVFNSGAASTVSGIISGNGSLAKAGSGLLTLSGSNTYSGGTTLTSGTVSLSNIVPTTLTAPNGTITSGLLGTGNVTINGPVTLTTGGQLNNLSAPLWNIQSDFTVAIANNTGNCIGLSGTFDMGGVSRVVTLSKIANDAVGSGSETVAIGVRSGNGFTPTFQNGTIDFEAGSAVTSGTFTLVREITTANFANNSGLIVGPNVVWNQTAFGTGANAPALTVNGFFYAGAGTISRNTEVFSLSGTGTYTNAATNGGTSTLTISGSSGTANFAGSIMDGNSSLPGTSGSATGIVALTKNGAGTQILSGNNIYTGPTSVAGGGRLIVSGSLTASATTITGNSTLGGAGTMQAVTNSVGTIAPGNLDGGNNSTIGTLNTGNLSTTGGVAHLAMQLGATTAGVGASDRVNVTGSVDVTNSDLLLSTITGYAPATNDVFYLVIKDGAAANAVTGNFAFLNGVSTTLTEGSTFTFGGQGYQITYQANFEGSSFTGGNDIALQAVPEPSTWAMMVGGVGALGFYQKLRRRKA